MTAYKRLLSTVFALLLLGLSACTKIKSDSAGFAPPPPTTNNQNPQNFDNRAGEQVSNGSSPLNDSINQAKACADAMRPVTRMVQACLPAMEQIDDADPNDVAPASACVESMHGLFAASCSGFQTQLNQTAQSCGGFFHQFQSQLPSTCLQAIQVVMN